MALPAEVTQPLAEAIAERLRAIGDPTRIRILHLLREDERSVAELTRRLDTSQQNVSRHLSILAQAGIVARRKQGTSSLYRVADPAVYELCELVCGSLEARTEELSALVGGAGRGP